MKKIFGPSLGLAVALGALGCAHKDMVKPDSAPQTAASPTVVVAAAMPQATPTPLPLKAYHYQVRKGDSLWSIAARPSVLGDPFRWPLLFKANRDDIADPDLIEVSQDLSYKQDVSGPELQDAIQKAHDTPPYAPHSEARKPLPLRY